MAALHFFNPGHETAIWLGTSNFTPSRNVQLMAKELAYLPIWYADPADYVLVPELPPSDFYEKIPLEWRHLLAQPITLQQLKDKSLSMPLLEALPWGISPHSLGIYNQLKKQIPSLKIEIPLWKEVYKELSHRDQSVKALISLKDKLEIDYLEVPQVCTSFAEVLSYLSKSKNSVIFKMPFSSSGRGLLWVHSSTLTVVQENWVKGVLKKQGSVSVEPQLDKKIDFALEYYSSGGNEIYYKGISVFGTNLAGAYGGNFLKSQEDLTSIITQYIGVEFFERLKKDVASFLQENYAAHYKGFIGVDMMLYNKDNKMFLHPCVEINMRYTMGIVAEIIYEKFYRKGEEGLFEVSYGKKDFNKNTLQLCPVNEETKYKASISIE